MNFEHENVHESAARICEYSLVLNFFLKLIFIKVYLLYNVVLVSTVQQNESIIYIHIISFHWDFLPNQVTRVHLIEFLVLYSMFSWVICSKHSINSIHASIPIFHSLPPPHSPWYPNIWTLCLCLYFCFANKIIYTIFTDSIYIYIYMHI